MDDTDLQLNFAEFCFDHFQHNDNTKDDQYKTPLGSKDNSPNGNESESIEVVETPSNTYRGPLQESTISSASTNNTDICVLDSHYTNDDIQFLPDDDVDDDDVDGDDDDEIEDDGIADEFIESEEGDEVFLRAVDVLDKHEDFTVLQKPHKSRRLCNCEESTEVLMLINSEYQEKRKTTYSGTDSDVEVLMSEEIIESDWAGTNDDDHENPQKSAILREPINILKSKTLTEASLEQSSSCDDGNSMKTQDSTDFDVSGEELAEVDAAAAAVVQNDKYQNLNRIQLLQVIQKQELCIQALEDTVKRYQKAQQRLFDHVDALRLELSEIRISPLKNIEQRDDV